MLFSKTLNNFQIPSGEKLMVTLDNVSISGNNEKIKLTYGNNNKETYDEIASEMMFLANKLQSGQLLSQK